MRLTLCLIPFLVLSLSAESAHARQNLDDPFVQEFIGKVKQIDEFIKRFNNVDTTFQKLYQEYRGEPLDRATSLRRLASNHVDSTLMERFIASVVEDKRRSRGGASSTSGPRGLQVIGEPTYLNFYDDHWYAEATCHVIYRKRSHKLTLILQNQTTEEQTSKWIIVAGKANFLTLVRRDTTKIIPPVNHDMNFQSLYRVFEDRGNLLNYTRSDFEPDPFSILLYAINKGDVTFNGVEKIRFHFLQLEDWAFQVEHFVDTEYPGGWMISQLTEASEEVKEAYKTWLMLKHSGKSAGQ